MKNRILNYISCVVVLLFFTTSIFADELTHKFKNPSFSGIGTSSHYLTVENQEKSRRDAIQDDIESALKQAERDEENTTLAKFFRNLESRIYAQLSKQLVENLFATCDSSLWACTQDEEVIVMTIVGEDGTETIIVIPIGAGSSGGG